MAVMNKPDEQIFASGAKNGEVVTFPNLARGWGITFDETNGIPPMEYFNALFKRLDEKDLYLLQRGVGEWSATMDYPVNALVQHNGSFYRSLQANKNKTPNGTTAYWTKWGVDSDELKKITPKTITATTNNSVDLTGHSHEIAKASTTQAGVVQLNSATNSNAKNQAATPKAVKAAFDRASTAINNAQAAQTAANNAQATANSKQSPATTLAGYGITDFIHKNLTSENLNDIKQTGIYGQARNANATTARNYPEQMAGALLVRPSAYGFMQEYVTYSGYRRYIRNQNDSGGWAAWQRIDFQLDNTLTSTSTTQALTAAQGKVLKESIDTKAPIHNPSHTGTILGGYRLVIDRNEAEYTPYIHLKDRSVDISQTLSKDKVVAQYLGVVKNGDGEQRVSYVHTVMRQDKNAELLLGAVGADRVNRWGIDVFGKTGNVAIGKTSDDGTNRLQVNGTATVTAPTATANNAQVPTTKWVRDTAILKDGVGQQISGSLQINSKTGWSGIWLGTKNGSWRLEGNPDDNDKRVNLVHKDQDGGQLYIRFSTITKDERVAYQSWVTEQAKSFVKKSGDTMTGTLIVPRIEVTSNNQGGNNIKIGDDAYIGDDQVAHTVKVRSATNNNVGFIAFGNSGARLGRGLNYNESILEWEGNYLSLNAKNDEYTGIDFLRNKSGKKYWSRFESLPDKRFKLIVEDSYEQFTQTKSGTLALLSDCTPELVTLFKGEFHSASHRTNITTGSVNGAVITLAQSFKNFRYLVAVVSNDEKTFYHQNISMTSLIPVGNSTAATFDLGGAGALFWFGRFLSNTQIQCINENCVLHAIYGTNAI